MNFFQLKHFWVTLAGNGWQLQTGKTSWILFQEKGICCSLKALEYLEANGDIVKESFRVTELSR